MNPPDSVIPLIDAVWKECRDAEAHYAASSQTKFGNPPKELRVFQAEDAHWDRGWVKEPYSRIWRYDGEVIEEIGEHAMPWLDEERDGMYWRIGMIQFAIDETNHRCIYTYTLGPRYGRGYKASSIDFDQFEMAPDEDRMLWIS